MFLFPTLGAVVMAGGLDEPKQVPFVSTVSTGKRVELKDHLMPELPTVFLFYKSNSSLEKTFMESLQKEIGERACLRLIGLRTGTEPVAEQYTISTTPTGVVFDRRGKEVTRSSDAEEIRKAVKHAAEKMRIDWAEPGDGKYEEAQKILGRPMLPGILRTMSLKPEYMRYINDLSVVAHFNDGFLKRRHKEMIATYVSALNKCKY